EAIRDRFEAWLASPDAETQVRHMGRISVLNAPIEHSLAYSSAGRLPPTPGARDKAPQLPEIPQVVVQADTDNSERDSELEDDEICSFQSGDEDAPVLSDGTDHCPAVNDDDDDNESRSSLDSERSSAFGLDSIREEDEPHGDL